MGKYAIILTIIGIVLFQLFARDLFSDTGSWNIQRTLCAGLVAGICAVIGGFFDSMGNKKDGDGKYKKRAKW